MIFLCGSLSNVIRCEPMHDDFLTNVIGVVFLPLKDRACVRIVGSMGQTAYNSYATASLTHTPAPPAPLR